MHFRSVVLNGEMIVYHRAVQKGIYSYLKTGPEDLYPNFFYSISSGFVFIEKHATLKSRIMLLPKNYAHGSHVVVFIVVKLHIVK